MRDVTDEGPGAASVWSLTAWAVMSLRDRDIPPPNIQMTGIKAALAITARISPVNWEIPYILSKVFLGRQQQYVGVVLLTQVEFCHPEQKVPPVIVTNTSVVVVATIRPAQGFLHDPGVDFLDAWQLRLGWMRHRIDNELCEIGVGYKRAGRVEDQDTAVRSRSLRLDEIAEAVELEICGKDAGHFASQGRANRDHRCADAE